MKPNNIMSMSRTGKMVEKLSQPWIVITILVLCVLILSCSFLPDLLSDPSESSSTPQPVGPQGGEINAPGGMKIIVPAGALESEIELSVKLIKSPHEIPEDYQMEPAGQVYEVVSEQEVELQNAVEIVLPLKRKAGANDNNYTVLHYRDGDWVDLGGVVKEDFIRTHTERLSQFAPMLGANTRKPVQFWCDMKADANIYAWTFTPSYQGVAGPPVIPMATCRVYSPRTGSTIMILPLGIYTFCVEYFQISDQQWYYYIRTDQEGIEDQMPDQIENARAIYIQTILPVGPNAAMPGRCVNALGRSNIGGGLPPIPPGGPAVTVPPGGPAATVPPGGPGTGGSGGFYGVIEFGAGADFYSVEIEAGIVVEGYARGSYQWTATDGLFDGKNLQATFVTTQVSGCKNQWTHYYLVEPTQVILLESVDGCGNWLKDRNAVYSRTK